jgi:uncharacterized protein DUF6289
MVQQLKRPIVRRTLLMALLIPILAVALWVSAPPSAAASNGANCTYYSDANHTTVVGQYGTDCCNNHIDWGIRTQYSVCSSGCFICYPPPR